MAAMRSSRLYPQAVGRRSRCRSLVALDMGSHMLGLDLLPFLAPQAEQWLKLALAAPVVLWCGWPFFVRGFASIRWAGSICSP